MIYVVWYGMVYLGTKLLASSSDYIEKKSLFHLGEDYMLGR